MQIHQGETLNHHQGAITHEVCCLAAQIYETKTYEFIKMWFYIEQLSLILEESVSQNLWGSQGKLCKENLGYCPEVFFYPPLLKRSIFSSHILPVIQKRHEYCTTFNVQQGLEIRGFWVQKKTVQSKTMLREVYTYVLNDIFFQKTVYLQGFCSKSMFREVTPTYVLMGIYIPYFLGF